MLLGFIKEGDHLYHVQVVRIGVTENEQSTKEKQLGVLIGEAVSEIALHAKLDFSQEAGAYKQISVAST